MEIKYLTLLNQYPRIDNILGSKEELKPTSMEEILDLENLYNQGRPFPASLRELLFIAGGHCYVLAYGSNESQKELQESGREDLVDYELEIDRPFYVIDIYNAHDMFLFVYLDENTDDPIVHQAVFENDPSRWLHSLNKKLSDFINSRLNLYLSGVSPF